MESGAPDFRQNVEDKNVSDEELLRQFCDDDDREAFTELIQRYKAELYSYLYRYTGHREMAEDAFQVMSTNLFRKAHQFAEGKRFRPWIYSIATRAAIDCYRRNGRNRNMSLGRAEHEDDHLSELKDSLPDPAEYLEKKETCEWVRAEVSKLSQIMRSVVQLVMLEGYKYSEAAEILNIPVGTVKSRLHNAIRHMHPDHPSKITG